MKLRKKIIVIFFISIIISVVVFFISAVYFAENITEGYSPYELHLRTQSLAKELTGVIESNNNSANQNVKRFLQQWKKQYSGIEVEYLKKSGDILYSSIGRKGNYPLYSLLEDIRRNDIHTGKKLYVSNVKNSNQDTTGVVVLHVPEKLMTPLQISLNKKGIPTILILFVVGLIIPLLVSGFFAYLFTYKINKRFNNVYHTIKEMDLNKLDLNLRDDSRDELGELVRKFKAMIARLKEQINQERRLISSISHDLKTPLASIIGYTESLQDKIYRDKAEREEFIEIIHDKAAYLNNLLEELLEMAQIQSKSFSLDREVIDINELLKQQILSVRPQMQSKDFEIEMNLPDHPVLISVDSARIQRIVDNIIDNALKYAAVGKYIKVSLEEKDDHICMIFSDRGPGLNIGEEDKVVQSFYQGDRSRSTGREGMGLGLAIVKRLVNAHQGELKIESINGKGTVVKVIIPFVNQPLN